MLGQNPHTVYQISHFFNEKVHARKIRVHSAIHSIVKVVQSVLKEVETQEPRFIPTLVESSGRYEGLIVHSPTEYEVILYLNQMGVFNFVDDGSIQGCAVLKLSDGRKRSMSLWVEFITASGYLSARKIRSRFQTLVAQCIEKTPYRDSCQLVPDTSDVKLRIEDKYIVQITCAFRCNGIWPRSAMHWPDLNLPWPAPNIAAEVKNEGFDLFSRETLPGPQTQQQQQPPQLQGKQSLSESFREMNLVSSATSAQTGANSMEGDAWAMSTHHAENILLQGGRRKAFSILKCLRDSHLDFPNSPVTSYILKTLLLQECEKHCNDYEWEDIALGDRIIGVLLQLVSCLQCRRCTHYFLPQLDLLRGRPSHLLDQSAKLAWNLVRQLMLNVRALEHL